MHDGVPSITCLNSLQGQDAVVEAFEIGVVIDAAPVLLKPDIVKEFHAQECVHEEENSVHEEDIAEEF